MCFPARGGRRSRAQRRTRINGRSRPVGRAWPKRHGHNRCVDSQCWLPPGSALGSQRPQERRATLRPSARVAHGTGASLRTHTVAVAHHRGMRSGPTGRGPTVRRAANSRTPHPPVRYAPQVSRFPWAAPRPDPTRAYPRPATRPYRRHRPLTPSPPRPRSIRARGAPNVPNGAAGSASRRVTRPHPWGATHHPPPGRPASSRRRRRHRPPRHPH